MEKKLCRIHLIVIKPHSFKIGQIKKYTEGLIRRLICIREFGLPEFCHFCSSVNDSPGVPQGVVKLKENKPAKKLPVVRPCPLV